jgi:hypothetical protein
MNKKSLIRHIQENSDFHRFANLEGHSIDQLKALKLRIISQKKGTKGEINKASKIYKQ